MCCVLLLGELPIEELVKKYAAAYDSDFELPSDGEDSDDTSVSSDSDLSQQESEEEEEEEGENYNLYPY